MRWQADQNCTCKNLHSQAETAEENLFALKELCSAMFAAEMFVDCLYSGKSDSFFKDLVDHSPMLVEIPVTISFVNLYAGWSLCQDSDLDVATMLPLGFVIMKRSNLVDFMLSSKGAPISDRRLDNVKNLSVMFQRMFYVRGKSLALATELHAKRHKEEMRVYRADDKSSLLHILFKNLTHFSCHIARPNMLECSKQLLELGVDPFAKDAANRTALDYLITSFSHFPQDNVMGWTLNIGNWLNDVLRFLTFAFAVYSVDLVVPCIPNSNSISTDQSGENTIMHVIKLARLLLTNDLFNIDYAEAFALQLVGMSEMICRMYTPSESCVCCFNFLDILHIIICKGTVINKTLISPHLGVNPKA